MKKFLKGILVLSLLAGTGFFALDMMLDHTSWKQVSEADSPDGAFTIFEYSYFSDANRHAPYGTYVFIKPAYSDKKPISSHVIFAGYCSNDNMYKWVGNIEIKLTCIASEKDSVKTLSKKAYGINIRAAIEHAKTP